VRQVAEAERRRNIALVVARQEAEAAATRAKIAAAADKETAGDRAEARRQEANARKHENLAAAEATRARIEAENTRGEHIIAMETDLARLEALPKIVTEMVKPAEKIESIDIHHLSGFGGAGGSGPSPASDRPVVNQALDSILEMAVQLPALKRIGEEIGLSLDKGMVGSQKEGSGKGRPGGDD